MHAISGCDTTSFFLGVGKIKIFKIRKDPAALDLQKPLGENEEFNKLTGCDKVNSDYYVLREKRSHLFPPEFAYTRL